MSTLGPDSLGAGCSGCGCGWYGRRRPDTDTSTALPHTDAGRADGRGFANTAAGVRGAAAGLRRELVTRHWKLGIPAGNRVALFGGDG